MSNLCTACNVEFSTFEEQRVHYRTEWHRHNSKRRMADLEPISEQTFSERVKVLTAVQQEVTTPQAYERECDVCRKVFRSLKSYEQHERSKKHKEREAEVRQQADPSRAERPKPVHTGEQYVVPGSTVPLTEEELEAELESRMEAIKTRPLEACLFCNKLAPDLEQSLAHMASAHGLFIPDVEYLKDVKGLVQYLKEKICVGFVCLWCNGTGKTFHSLDAVQHHMIDKSHCRIPYEEAADWDEFSEFYDYSASPVAEGSESGSELSEGWEEAEGNDEDLTEEGAGQTDKPARKLKSEISRPTGDNAFELVLKDGRKLGHRDLQRYYKQNLKQEDKRDAVVCSLIESYKSMDLSNFRMPQSSLEYRRNKILARAQAHESRKRETWYYRLGMTTNETGRSRFVNRTLMWT
eukprot:c316_g1_i1.p1 GENE.c316_g1_i1~~c316_g1_i1.p1  ORF type:complete len:408 (+),score=91.28 c316_g1_i1:33-1256(+)